MDIKPHTSVESYFRGVVVEAMRRARVEATEHTEFYLVSLLGAFATTPIPDEPLAMKLASPPSSPGERVATLKQVGDTSLYMTGFFAESLERRLVGVDYYIELGEAAYRELAGRLGSTSACEVYEELAAKFPRFVDVLAAVREQAVFAGADVVRLYEQWLHTRSEWIEHRLRALGVLVGDSGSGMLQ